MSFEIVKAGAKKILQQAKPIPGKDRLRIPVTVESLTFIGTGLYQNVEKLTASFREVKEACHHTSDYAKYGVAYIEVDTFVIPD